jgi:SNW domain-containing protein 1
MPVQHAEKQAPVQYIRYTPSQQEPAFNSGAKQRIIQMIEVQKDPMKPPRFKRVQVLQFQFFIHRHVNLL